jgi:uncharacterized protein YeaO (DUF488 family)
MIKIKRIYERPEFADGLRILVDRLWPRGVRRSTANVDIWLKEVGPSDELRKWYAHDPKKWVRFKQRYLKELKGSRAFEEIIDLARTNDTLTLLFATQEVKHNNAIVLAAAIEKELAKIAKRLKQPIR